MERIKEILINIVERVESDTYYSDPWEECPMCRGELLSSEEISIVKEFISKQD